MEEGKYDSYYTILAGISLHLKRIPFGYYFKRPMGPGPPHFRNLTQAKYIFIPTFLLPFIHPCIHSFIIE